MVEKICYTLEEAKAATGLSDDTLYRKHAAGEITMVKAGRRVLIPADDLKAYIASLPQLPRRRA